GGHDEQNSALSTCDGLNGPVNGIDLVVARLLTHRVFVIGLNDEFFILVSDASELLVPLPELLRRWECFEWQLILNVLARRRNLVVGSETIAVRAEGAGNFKNLGIAQCLLDAVTDDVT